MTQYISVSVVLVWSCASFGTGDRNNTERAVQRNFTYKARLFKFEAVLLVLLAGSGSTLYQVEGTRTPVPAWQPLSCFVTGDDSGQAGLDVSQVGRLWALRGSLAASHRP
eukprot:3036059-Rhodomonas_salina.1